jgi:hypothetical protein
MLPFLWTCQALATIFPSLFLLTAILRLLSFLLRPLIMNENRFLDFYFLCRFSVSPSCSLIANNTGNTIARLSGSNRLIWPERLWDDVSFLHAISIHFITACSCCFWLVIFDYLFWEIDFIVFMGCYFFRQKTTDILNLKNSRHL